MNESKPHIVGSIVFEDRVRSMQLGVDEVLRLMRKNDELLELLSEGRDLVLRYLKETPPGHQPHMITAIAEDWVRRAVK